MHGKTFEFEGFVLDEGEQRLLKNGQDVQLPPKVFEVLTVLLANHGQLVTNEQLRNAVWADTFVEEGNLRYCIHSLRKVIGSSLIATVPKRGYRLEATVILQNGNGLSRAADAVNAAPGLPAGKVWTGNGPYRFLAVALVFVGSIVTIALFAITSGERTAAGKKKTLFVTLP